MKPASFLAVFIFLLTVGLLAGCGRKQDRSADNAAQLHKALPPHGGTALALGDDYQIEWVLDAAAGKLQAYVMDGEMENFARITPPSFDVTAKLPGHEEALHFVAIANAATGEEIGSTALFEAQADWLKTTHTFSAVLKEINVKGTVFSNVVFNFPK